MEITDTTRKPERTFKVVATETELRILRTLLYHYGKYAPKPMDKIRDPLDELGLTPYTNAEAADHGIIVK